MRFSTRFPRLLLLPAAALALVHCVSFGCRDMRPRSQEWVVWAPEKAIVGVSLHLGWTLERPEIREIMARYPAFDQALEILLDKARLDPTSETGRASFYVLDVPRQDTKGTETALLDDLRGMALVQLAGFRDPKAIQRVIVENFPPEGSIRAGGREYPLFVFFDINNVHLRVFLDSDDRLWIGDVTALQGVAQRRFVGDAGPLARAAEWIQASGAVQGFVQPDLVPRATLGAFSDSIPAGVKGLAWSISTTENDPDAVSLNVAATGTEEGIAQVKPWMQRMAAAASAVSGEGAPPPETLNEKTTMGLKCQIKQEQLDKVFDVVNLGGAATTRAAAAPKPSAAK